MCSTASCPTQINEGVPEGSVIVPLLVNLFISDQSNSNQTISYNFADEKVITYNYLSTNNLIQILQITLQITLLSNNQDPKLFSSYLKNHFNHLEMWYKQIQVHSLNLLTSHGHLLPLFLNNQSLSSTQQAQYLGIFIDRWLT